MEKFTSKTFSPQRAQRDTEKSKSLFMGKSTSKTFASQRAQRDTDEVPRPQEGVEKRIFRRGKNRDQCQNFFTAVDAEVAEGRAADEAPRWFTSGQGAPSEAKG